MLNYTIILGCSLGGMRAWDRRPTRAVHPAAESPFDLISIERAQGRSLLVGTVGAAQRQLGWSGGHVSGVFLNFANML